MLFVVTDYISMIAQSLALHKHRGILHQVIFFSRILELLILWAWTVLSHQVGREDPEGGKNFVAATLKYNYD